MQWYQNLIGQKEQHVHKLINAGRQELIDGDQMQDFDFASSPPQSSSPLGADRDIGDSEDESDKASLENKTPVISHRASMEDVEDEDAYVGKSGHQELLEEITRPSEYLRKRCPLCFGSVNWSDPQSMYVAMQSKQYLMLTIHI